MNQIGQIVENIMRHGNLWEQYQRHYIIHNWGVMVGEKLSAVSEAVEIRKGILKVLVRDSIWAYHLSLLKPQLIDKLNEARTKKLIHDIYFQVGEFAEKKEKQQERGKYITGISAGENSRELQNQGSQSLFRIKIRQLYNRCSVK